VTPVELELEDARLLVEARLGRPPQDMLEAAVVLEAWAGVPAQAALAAASATMPAEPALPQPSVGRLPRRRDHEGVLVDSAAFMITVLAIAFWAAPLTSAAGLHAVTQALAVALPVTIALQRALGSRFLDRPNGIAQLALYRGRLLAGAVAVLLIPAALLGLGGTLAGLLTITWTGGAVLIRRGWPLVYVAIVLLATGAMAAGAPALAVVAAAAATTLIEVAVALARSAEPVRRTRGGGEPVVIAAAIGIGLGLMLVLDGSVSWTEGSAPAVALVPSTVAALLAGHHLLHLEMAIPRALSGVEATAPEAGAGRLGREPVAVLGGALARLLLVSAALSVALLWLSPWLGSSARGAGVLVGFALIAAGGMLAGLLESLGRSRGTLAAVAAGTAAEALVRVTGLEPFAGIGLVVGGGVVTLLVLPAVAALLRRPASTLATALRIP
jgi:hypothetical protein